MTDSDRQTRKKTTREHKHKTQESGAQVQTIVWPSMNKEKAT